MRGLQATRDPLQLKDALVLLVTLLHCHPPNQATLLSHASLVTEAVAALLQELSPACSTQDSREVRNVTAATLMTDPAQQYRQAAALLAKRSGTGQASALTTQLDAQPNKHLYNSPSSQEAAHFDRAADPTASSSSGTGAQPSSGHQSGSEGSSATAEAMSHSVERVLKNASYILLLYLPAAALQAKADFWLQHAEDLPFLLRGCILVALTQSNTVR